MKQGFNIEVAIELYYSQNELSNKDIRRIFGCSESYVQTLKNKVREKMAEEKAHPVVFEAKNVNCAYAFRVWGLDVEELEQKYKKLQCFRKLKEDGVA